MGKRIIILYIALLPGLLMGQNQVGPNDFTKDFNDVAGIFEKTIQPYLHDFAKNRFSPDLDSMKRLEAVNSHLSLLKMKVEKLRSESFEKLSSESNVNREFLFGYFSMLFSMEFLGLTTNISRLAIDK